jgi:hypothetical protein
VANKEQQKLRVCPLGRAVVGGFEPRSGYVGFVVDIAALKHVCSEYFAFRCSSPSKRRPTYKADSVSTQLKKYLARLQRSECHPKHRSSTGGLLVCLHCHAVPECTTALHGHESCLAWRHALQTNWYPNVNRSSLITWPEILLFTE